MTRAELRILIVTNPALVRDLMLTDFNIKVLNYIKENKTCRSSDIASKFEICTISASIMLKWLHKKGYLSRWQQPDPSGGHYYEYRYNLIGDDDVVPV